MTAKTPRKAAFASSIGSVLEYYDFFIYGTAAALVFGKVFFPDSDPATGTLLSFATYGVGYVARPIGALFMGHLGDRHGRKRVLVLTVLMMGTATFLVGCLPTYDDIGIWAPVLLVTLRLMQGFSASGEQSGGNSLTLEHAPDNRRAFFSSFTLMGTQAGLVIATAVWLPIGALPEDQLLSWGWRVPFWLSAFVVLAAFIIRRRLDETPAFEEAAREGAIGRAPVGELLRDHLPALIRVTLVALGSTVSTIFAVYALSFAVDNHGLDKTTMLWVAIVTNVVAGGDPAVGDARRPHRAQAGAGRRGAGQRRADVRLPGGDRERDLRAHLRGGDRDVGHRLQRVQRRPARAVRRDVPDSGPPLRHGARHPDRLRDRRLRADGGGGDRRRRLDAGRAVRVRLQPDRRGHRAHRARDVAQTPGRHR